MSEESFSARLRVAMAWRGKNGRELADELGISNAAVSKFTTSGGYPNSAKLLKISRFLRVSIDYLMSGPDVDGQIEDVLSNMPPRMTERQAMVSP